MEPATLDRAVVGKCSDPAQKSPHQGNRRPDIYLARLSRGEKSNIRMRLGAK